MKSIILVVSVLVAFFTITINAFPANEQIPIKERSIDSFDLALMETDPYFERLYELRNRLAFTSSGEIVPSFETVKPKRGRQCLWKICSWSLEKSKKKGPSSVLTIDN
ncbi:unnamed protein product [Brachionus calyciflorus]|uniref:Uncharacterized protein n=1 Tax=Brachionus calyciflorus TaxID=104777 RepID=A0A813PXI9_9BILA|nr:unnamed protein product [Brachionus calyciflorus]